MHKMANMEICQQSTPAKAHHCPSHNLMRSRSFLSGMRTVSPITLVAKLPAKLDRARREWLSISGILRLSLLPLPLFLLRSASVAAAVLFGVLPPPPDTRARPVVMLFPSVRFVLGTLLPLSFFWGCSL
jgi:hypothetical protein